MRYKVNKIGIHLVMLLAGWLVALPVSAQSATFQGVVDWFDPVQLTSGVSDMVVKVHGSAGKPFSQGDILVELDPGPFDTAVAAQKALFQAAEKSFEEANREHERFQELFDEGSLALVEMDQADMKLEIARGRFMSAKAAYAGARYRKGLSVHKASFDGVIVARRVSPGQSPASTILSQLIDRTQLHTELARLRPR